MIVLRQWVEDMTGFNGDGSWTPGVFEWEHSKLHYFNWLILNQGSRFLG